MLPIFVPILKLADFSEHLGAAPGLVSMAWIAILIAVNLQTSFLTPPFGFTLFYMRGTVPPSITIQHIYRGIIPFVVLQLIGLGLTIAFPELVLWLPRISGFLY